MASGLRWWCAVSRLAALLAALGLATTALGTIAHELAGHGGAVLATGGAVNDVRLFWFGGGWITYNLADNTLTEAVVVALAGVTVEITIGIAAWVALARRRTLVARLVRGLGAALVIHGCTYLAMGMWYGYGDGRIAHGVLGDGRYPVAIALLLVACGAAYQAARLVYRPLSMAVPGGRAARFAGVAVALALAIFLQLGLTFGEARVRRDATYAQGMQPERERVVARELEKWRARMGQTVTAGDVEHYRDELAERNREPPFTAFLLVALIGAIALGTMRSRGDAVTGEVSRRLVARASIAALASIALVIALDLALR